jgi:hypothetical protein
MAYSPDTEPKLIEWAKATAIACVGIGGLAGLAIGFVCLAIFLIFGA